MVRPPGLGPGRTRRRRRPGAWISWGGRQSQGSGTLGVPGRGTLGVADRNRAESIDVDVAAPGKAAAKGAMRGVSNIMRGLGSGITCCSIGLERGVGGGVGLGRRLGQLLSAPPTADDGLCTHLHVRRSVALPQQRSHTYQLLTGIRITCCFGLEQSAAVTTCCAGGGTQKRLPIDRRSVDRLWPAPPGPLCRTRQQLVFVPPYFRTEKVHQNSSEVRSYAKVA